MNEGEERKIINEVHGIMYYDDNGELVVNSNYEHLFYIKELELIYFITEPKIYFYFVVFSVFVTI